MQVKEERPEDAEIQALAAKMVEANKAKMAISQSVPLQQRGPGPGLLSYFNRRPLNAAPPAPAPVAALLPQSNGPAVPSQSPSSNSSAESTAQQDKQPFDSMSQMGKSFTPFGMYSSIKMGTRRIKVAWFFLPR